MNAPVVVNVYSAESVVSAAKLFAAGDAVLTYIYTYILLRWRWTVDAGQLVDVSVKDLQPTDGLPHAGVWWVVPHHKGEDCEYLGFLKPGDHTLYRARRWSEYIFREGVDTDFDVYVWHRHMETEREFAVYLRELGREPDPWDACVGGTTAQGDRWYRDTKWPAPSPVRMDHTPEQMARVYTGEV